MTSNLFLKKIGLEERGINEYNRLSEKEKSNEFFLEMLRCAKVAYEKGDAEFGNYVKAFAEYENITPEELTLFLYIKYAIEAYQKFVSAGISDEIYFDSFRSISIVAGLKAFNPPGVYGIPQDVYRDWMRRCIGLKIFRLGRLEFEIAEAPFDINDEIGSAKRGETCIFVHIPRYDPLADEICEASYKEARCFFKEKFNMKNVFFICESWMLHPWLSEDLSETSNIVKFQKHFKLLKTEQDVITAANWIFPGLDIKNCELPENTSIERAAKNRIKNGMPIGTATGIRR